MMYQGFEVIVDDLAMSDAVEDWSTVRSPSRAKRRLKRGFRQNISIKRVPKTEVYKVDSGAFGYNPFGISSHSRGQLIMHSVMKKELLKKLEKYTNE